MMRIGRRGFLLGATAALAGCAQVSYEAPAAKVPADFDAAAPGRAAQGPWWSAFRDKTLDQLIAAGRARNLDVLQAVAAIEAARATAAATGAADVPQLSGTVTGTRGNTTGTGVREVSSGALAVGWTADLFGANRANRAAASARLDAAYASADVARLVMEGAIAQAYADLRYQQASIALTRKSLESRRKSLELTRAQVDSGTAGRLELLQAEQLVAEGEAQLPGYETGFDQALVTLATLTAQPVAALRPQLTRGAGQPRPRYKASVGVPADVLRARPDVRLAERNYAAAVYDIGVAKAAFYPSVTLSGSITPTHVRDANTIRYWAVGPSINLPIFTGGANRANLRGAEARALEAKLAWEKAVLTAIDEVESALAAYNRDGRNIAAQAHLVETSAGTLELSRTNYSLGEGDFMTVLDAERSYLSAQQSQAAAERQRAVDFITLSVAAAGGIR
ncbi:efflux transporter outer membrane subunit [Rhodobacter capsulatus]|uniref:efflux transporter outer membrane subunit n=1 Tax=Rhodobacter capsulatus TaxID=1061 RepID=UPI00402A4165